MTAPVEPAPVPRRSRRPDALTLVLAAILLGGVVAGVVGAWSLAGRSDGATSSTLVGPPSMPPADPGSLLGPTGSPPASPAATAGPAGTPGATPPPTPAPSAPPTPAPTPAAPTPSPSPTAAPGYPAIEDAVAAVLDRMAIPERFAGDCDVAPPDTVCGGQLAELAGAYAWAVGYSGTDFLLGTVVVRQDPAGWHPVIFDPGAVVAAGESVVGGTGDCLPLRGEARRDAAPLGCLPDGTRVGLTGVMTVADGYLWAEAEGGGWLPSRWLCGPACEGVPDTVWSFEPAP